MMLKWRFRPLWGTSIDLTKPAHEYLSILENQTWHEDVKLVDWRWRHTSPHFDNLESGVITCLHYCKYCLLRIHNFNWTVSKSRAHINLSIAWRKWRTWGRSVSAWSPVSFGALALTPSVQLPRIPLRICGVFQWSSIALQEATHPHRSRAVSIPPVIIHGSLFFTPLAKALEPRQRPKRRSVEDDADPAVYKWIFWLSHHLSSAKAHRPTHRCTALWGSLVLNRRSKDFFFKLIFQT